VDLDLRVKPRDPEASIRVALRDVRSPDAMDTVGRASLPCRVTRRFEGQLLPALMSAFGGKADIALTCRYVRFWPKADNPAKKQFHQVI
jgi:hypothetical protein